MTDIATGLYAHGAILAALLQRQQTGIGQKIDVNLLSTQVACLINVASNYLNANKEAKRWGTAHESIVRKFVDFASSLMSTYSRTIVFSIRGISNEIWIFNCRSR